MELFFQQLVNGSSLGFAYALLAVGFTVVFGTIKILNYAHGDIAMIASFVALVILERHLGFIPSILIAIVAGTALALVLERTLVRRVSRQSFLAPFVVTLGAALIMEAGAKQIWGTEPHLFPDGFPETTYMIGGVRIGLVQIIIAATAVVAMGALGWAINRTRVGLQVRATAQDPLMARAAGVNTKLLSSATMAVSGGLAAIAGVLLAVAFGVVSPSVGATYGLKGMIAMIVGGIGSLRGAVIAGLAIGIGEVMIVAYVNSTWRDAIAFGALILVLLWRPAGLFGKREERYVPAAV